MAKAKQTQHEKLKNLQQEFQPDPPAVMDELFADGDEFFDPTDIVQVKYEMLRRVAEDGQTVSEAIHAFGFSSRQSFYTAKAAFEQSGLRGLMPLKPGPRQAHKMTAEVLDFIRQARKNDPSLKLKELTKRVRKRFHLNIHEKSIARALARVQEESSTY
ncbi:MAG TPA: helix-turn-helix domain-containing protein [Terriglobia bacterium]|nr:helix-turn-helix domain-containing protein [Terriglobia bacterium]